MRGILQSVGQTSIRKFIGVGAAVAVAFLLAGRGSGLVEVLAQTANCLSPANTIVAENCLAGHTDWDITASDPDIQGFATDISVNTGETVTFKINTDATNYRIDIYRMGYYGGAGARKVASMTVAGAQVQPACITDTATGLVDCGNWSPSASWATTGATSGIYIAKLVRTDGNPTTSTGTSHIVFVVRNDASTSDVLFQTSDTTWQAYNTYGGNSLYDGGPGVSPARAYKVSYNRPFDTRDDRPESWVFNAEYPMVRWLEANGYDVTYFTGVDSDRRGALIANHKTFLSVGHDEYWSGAQRAHVEAARDNAGVNLAFFSGNSVFWKTRWESSIDGSITPYRTLVSYKETHANAKLDTSTNEWTGTWRDPRFSPPADGGRPENALTGTLWTVNCCTYAITVPGEMASHRFWRNTEVAQLLPGDSLTLSANTLGYEWDEDIDNGFRPAGLTRLSQTTIEVPERLIDNGSNTAPGVATHSLTLYRTNTIDPQGNPRSALVFGAGTVQWSWGLDGNHDRGASIPDLRMQQATVNLLVDMGVQPGSLQEGLVVADLAEDDAAPIATITSPANGTTVPSGVRVSVRGTADDVGGAVASVEVSVDGGTTWHLANGTSTWSYDWLPTAEGTSLLQSRATDDSGNVGAASTPITVTVGPGNCPCTSLWDHDVTVPALVDGGDAQAVELGVKFSSDSAGFITGIRFYKAPANTGTHVGNLWTEGGTLLATAMFTDESASGWQRVTFDSPVEILANTTYVASYHTNVGHYSVDRDYFETVGVDSAPLHAPAGANGVYTYGVSAFPTQTFRATNYWVDVDFASTVLESSGPVISNIEAVAIDGSTAQVSWTTNEDADSRITYSTNPALPPSESASLSSAAFVEQHTMVLTGLTSNATYYFRIVSVDRSGNAAVSLAPSVAVPGPTLHDTAQVDFRSGTPGTTCDVNGLNCVANTYAAGTGNGELILAPTAGTEFFGTSLDPGWIAVQWESAGSAVVGQDTLTVDGARVGTCDLTLSDCEAGTYGPGHSLEFVATFTGDPWQHAGFAIRMEDVPWAVFTTFTGGTLYARTGSGSTDFTTALGTHLLGSSHRFRVDWTSTAVHYTVDGALVASHPVSNMALMRPLAASDFNAFGGKVVVDWMRLAPYATSGSFHSRVFDAQTAVDWKTITWSDTTPAGTTLALSVRTGDTPTPDDGTWSAFAPVAAPGAFTAHARYVQYRADLTSTDPSLTPELTDIIITTAHAPVAVNDSATTALNTSYMFSAADSTSLTANDTDADTAAAQLRVVSVTPPAHGTVMLSSGSVTYMPAANYTGSDTFTYTISDGMLTDTATVSMSIGANGPPAGADDTFAVNEDGVLSVPADGITANDNDPDGDNLTTVLVTPPSRGTVVLESDGAFVYTPFANLFGLDTFTYQSEDPFGNVSNIATVSVNVAPINDAPSFVKGADQTVAEDAGLQTIAGWATAISAGPDEAGQALAFVIGNDRPELFSTQPALALDGTLTFTPAADASGTSIVTLQLRDDGGIANGGADTSAAQTFAITITPVNDNPVAVDDSATVAEDSGANPIAVLANDTMGADSGETLSVTSVTQGAHGTVSFTAEGVSYTPAADYNGADSFSYMVSDGNGGNATAIVSVTVTAVNDNPIAAADAATVAEDSGASAIDVLANDNMGPDSGETLTVTAVTQGANGSVVFTASGVSYTPVANFNGADSFTYTIGDGNGGTATATVSVTVTAVNDDPIAAADSATVAEDSGASAIDVLVNDNMGPDSGETLTVTAVTQGANGSAAFTATGVTYTPAANFNGSDSFTYTIADGNGGSATATVSVTVTAVNDNPIAAADAATVAEDSGATAIDVLANDNMGPDSGETLTVTAVTQGANGSAAFTATGVTYTPAANFNGADSFTYTIADGNGGSATATVSVTVTAVNDDPIAAADAATVAEDSGASAIDVLANDNMGPDSGETLTVTAVTQGANGSAAFTATGVTYTPAANFNGSDSFTYTIGDGNGGSATATVSVTVTAVNDDPVAAADAATVAEDSGASAIDVLANDNMGPDSGETLTVTAVTQGANGSAAFTATGVTYTPAANFNGSDSFTYTIGDGNGGSATATVSVTVTAVNDNPIAAADAATVAEDSSANAIDVLANDSIGADLGETLSVTAVTQGANGSVTFTASGVSYTPAANFNGSDSFTYTIADGNGGSATASVSVTVTAVNDDPIAAADSATVAEDSSANAIDVLANDSIGADLGETLSVSAVTQGANGSVSFTASGVTYTPAANFNGSDSFTYTIGDGNGGSATATVSVTVTAVNDAPIAAADAATVAEDSSANAIDVLANDSIGADLGETLTVTAVTQGANGSVAFTASGVSYTPAANFNGADSFTYTIGDGNGGSATASVSVTVTAVNDDPMAAADSATVAEDSSANAIDVLANDSIGADLGETLAVTAVTQGANGSVAFTASGVSYTPAANFNGSDSFTYTIGDGNGGSATATVSVTVTAVNDNPIAAADAATVAEDSSANAIDVLANDSIGADLGETLAVTAVTQGANGSVSFTASGVSYTPAANFNGADSFTYTIGDGNGGSATATVSVTVTAVNDNPIAAADAATVAEDSSANAIDVLANDSIGADLGETLAVTAVSQGANGSVSFTASGVTYTPAANFNGSDSFTYTIGDGNGGTATATVSATVTAVNDNPIAAADAATVAEDSSANAIDVLANDSIGADLGETLAVTAVTQGANGSVAFTATGVSYTPAANFNGADSFTYTIGDGNGGSATATVSVTVTAVNDNPIAAADAATVAEDSSANAIDVLANDSIGADLGETLSVSAVTQGANGSVAFTATGVTYTPAANFNGSDSFTYTIGDGNGGSATATVSVTVTAVNDNPIAAADAATVAEDSSANAIDVLANDSIGADLGETLAVTAVSQGANGSVSFTASGVSYTPAANFNGSDSFTYTIADGNGGSATATVSVTVTAVNDAPVAADDLATIAEDSGASAIDVLANDSDGVDAGETLEVSSVTQGANGTVSFTELGVTYTPAANFNGSDSFTYTIADGNGGSASATVNVTVTSVNDAPLAANDAATAAEDSGATAIAVLANDGIGVDAGETLTVTAVTQGANGSVTFTASGVSYTPAANFNGADSFTYTIGDGNGGAATASVSMTITSVNDAPSFTKGADQSVVLDSGAQSVAGWATAISAGAADESAQALDFIVTNDNNALFASQPAVSATGTLTFTSASGATGSATVSVRLHDNGGIANGGADTSAVQMFTITITPPPTLTIDNVSVVEGNSGTTPAVFTVTLSPAASATVTVSYQTLNGTARSSRDYVETSGTLTFTPGQVTQTIVVDVNGETTKESDETFAVNLSSATNAILGDSSGLGVIVDDDKTPQLKTSSARMVEGDTGEQAMLFEVSMTNDTSETMTVDYMTVQGVEAREGVDYEPVTGTLVFPPETLTPQFIRVPVKGDKRHERTQRFLVRLLNPVFAEVVGIDGIGEIEDDDPVPTISISDVSVGEANSGTVKAALTVTLSNETNELVTVNYATADNSALAVLDYAAAAGVLTFEPGTTNHVITIDVNAATAGEAIETFYVDLAAPVAATLAKSRGVVTITPPEAWVTSTLEEFRLGTLGAGGYLAETTGGEITLAPTVGTEFSGAQLPADWVLTVLADGGGSTAGSGAITVDGASIVSPTLYGSGRTLEFVATFSGEPNQNAGFGLTTALLPPFAMFGVKDDGQFYARSVAPGQVIETPLAGSWFGTPHHFRIDWNARTVVFWVDGTQRAVHDITFKGATASMRPAITDLTTGGGSISVDWMRMTPYAASGSYTSPVFDAAADVVWGAASWVAELAAGTNVAVEVRTGTTADPLAADANWTAFTPVASGGALTGVSRYAQYRVTLSTSVPNAAPALKEVTVTFQK